MSEEFWRVKKGDMNLLPQACFKTLTKECLMVLLQNVTSIKMEFHSTASFKENIMDKTTIIGNSSHTEQCDCPKEYSGHLCQNPNKGYYRFYPTDPNESWINKAIGVSRPCKCNGKSKDCHPETGDCRNCTDNTSGAHCELCKIGYYKNSSGKCVSCMCPSKDQNNAISCTGGMCECKPGYSGEKCDKCSDGYYPTRKKPQQCLECNCNKYGRMSNSCDSTGKCICKSGFRGDKCDKCINDREYIKDGKCVPCDDCSKKLLDDLKKLNETIQDLMDAFKNGLSPPWKILSDKKLKYQLWSNATEKLCSQSKEIIENAHLDQHENKINKMYTDLKVYNKEADNVTQTSYEISTRVKTTLDELDELRQNITDIIKNLNAFGDKHIDTKKALTTAKDVLSAIDDIIKKFEEYRYDSVFDTCSKIKQQIKQIYETYPFIDPNEVRKNIKALNNKMKEMKDITNKVGNLTKLVVEKNKENAKKMEKVKKKIAKVVECEKRIKRDYNDTVSNIAAVRQMLDDLSNVQSSLANIDLDELLIKLDNKDVDLRPLEDVVSEVREHVKKIEKKKQDYERMFNFSRDDWDKIRASSAYESIIKTISDARKTAKKSQDELEKTLKKLLNYTGDSLFVNSTISRAASERLHQRINNLKNKSSNYDNVRKQIDNLKENMKINGQANNNLVNIIMKLEEQFFSSDEMKKIKNVTLESTKISDEMYSISKNKTNQLKIRDDLNKTFVNYLRIKSMAGNITDKLKNASIDLSNLDISGAYNKIININNNKLGSESRNNLTSFQKQINELKNKIQHARKTADSLKFGFVNCTRNYSLTEGVLFTNINISFRCNCIVFHWQEKHNMKKNISLIANGNDLMLEVFNGSETKTTKIKISPLKYYTVSLENIYGEIKMTAEHESTSIETGNVNFFMDTDDTILLGKKLTEDTIYIYNFEINNKPIGLWNFQETDGSCKAYHPQNDTSYDHTYLLDGKGYVSTTVTSNAKPHEVHLKFSFATFDNNSIIYIAQENENAAAYMLLKLEDGYIVFNMRHSSGESVTLKTDNRYNNGSNTNVGITLALAQQTYIQTYQLQVNGDEKISQSQKLGKGGVFRIKLSTHYFGGISDIFNKDNITLLDDLPMFVGIIDLKMADEFSKNNIRVYGAKKTTNDNKLNLMKFWIPDRKNGCINITAPPLRDNIIFTMRTKQNESFLMEISDYAILYIKDKKLYLETIPENETVHSENNITEDAHNIVEIELEVDKISLTLGNIRAGSVKLPNKFNKNAKTTLRFGNISVGGHSSFEGGISGIYMDRQFIYLNESTVRNFANVEIGRDRLLKLNIEEDAMTKMLMRTPHDNMQNTERCNSVSNFVTEVGAIKLGDKPSSYIYVHNMPWKKDYKLEFQFRTFYSNGLLFVSMGGQKLSPHYNLLELREGKIQLHVQGKKNKVFRFDEKINDGNWHSIQMMHKGVKKKRKLVITIDDNRKKPVRVPKNNVRNDIYLGDLPNSLMNNMKLIIHPFRGCIRSFSIDNVQQLNKKSKYNNVGQCFPKIEDGAYFGGDAYAIYNKNFKVSKFLEVSFEFRTGEQNGILLSVSNPNNSPALSVELQNGAVVMKIDMGNGAMSKVTNNVGSDFALCDNRWHNVTAVYSDELLVNVDGIQKVWVVSMPEDADASMGEISAPLYIGGIKDNAPIGTLKYKENFKGCIRKLKVDDTLKDWTDMDELNNVLLNSCPV